jgi:hypothetical protein
MIPREFTTAIYGKKEQMSLSVIIRVTLGLNKYIHGKLKNVSKKINDNRIIKISRKHQQP